MLESPTELEQMEDDFTLRSLMEDFSLEELLELHDITEDQVVRLLYRRGWISHPLGTHHDTSTEEEEP
jgi:hypothetical protein